MHWTPCTSESLPLVVRQGCHFYIHCLLSWPVLVFSLLTSGQLTPNNSSVSNRFLIWHCVNVAACFFAQWTVVCPGKVSNRLCFSVWKAVQRKSCERVCYWSCKRWDRGTEALRVEWGNLFSWRSIFKSVLNCFLSCDHYLRSGGEMKTCQDNLSKSLKNVFPSLKMR